MGYALDFNISPFGQSTDLHHGSGRPMFREIFGIDCVELGKIAYVGEKYIDGRHVVKIASCGQHNLPQIFQGLARLRPKSELISSPVAGWMPS